MLQTRLRTKILLALLTISAVLSCGILAVVRYTVQKTVRESIRQDLRSSVRTYRTFANQREESLTRSTALIADLPTVRALMTFTDPRTIQDSAADLLKESGADLLVLADRRGRVCAVQSQGNRFPNDGAQKLLESTLLKNESRDWWLADGRLYEVIALPIHAGPAEQSTTLGILIAGHQVDEAAARYFSTIAGSEMVFHAGNELITAGLRRDQLPQLAAQLAAKENNRNGDPFELQLGREKFLATTQTLSRGPGMVVSLSVLKSFDKATAFLSSLNRLVLGLGLLAIVLGSALGFLISNSITKPLEQLVEGVNALKKGDFSYPLMARSRDEVGVVTESFAQMRESLQRGQLEQKELENRLRQAHKMEAVGRLAGGVAHDFNNLLTIIRGHSDLLADRVGGDSEKKSVEQIHRAADRAVGMTRQLLAFSRMQVLQPRVLDLNNIISEMGKMLPRLIGEHIEYSFVADPKVAPVKADPGQIEQVLMNLAVNARDAMPEGGKLLVRTSKVHFAASQATRHPSMGAGEYALISVQDTGHGMSEETIAHIFEPFFTTKEVGKGTGLGLATVYGIVKQSGGFIWVDSAPGRGATFHIYLPAVDVAVEKQADGKVRSLPQGKETILVVEDEPAVRDLTVEFLQTAGYKVLEARDGADALEVAGRFSGKIDLLLTDMVMPRMSGKELANQLQLTRPETKVVIMSGYSEYNAEGSGEKAGYATMAKPFSMASLAERMHEELRAAVNPN